MRVGIIVALLLLVASQASGDCAWVLWSGMTTGKDRHTDYELNLAYKTREECGSAVRTTAESVKKTRPMLRMYQAKSSPYEVYFEDSTGAGVRYFCLPDTVDPRGPKGK